MLVRVGASSNDPERSVRVELLVLVIEIHVILASQVGHRGECVLSCTGTHGDICAIFIISQEEGC